MVATSWPPAQASSVTLRRPGCGKKCEVFKPAAAPPLDDGAEIARLAALSLMAYERERDAAAKRLLESYHGTPAARNVASSHGSTPKVAAPAPAA